MGQACGFRQIFIVKLKRWRNRRIQNLNFAAEDFDFARGQVFIGRASRALAHQARDTNTKFVTQAFSDGKAFNVIWIKHDLG